MIGLEYFQYGDATDENLGWEFNCATCDLHYLVPGKAKVTVWDKGRSLSRSKEQLDQM